MYEEDSEDEKLTRYIEMGVVSIEGIDENGELIFSISEDAKDLAPELWEAHINYVDKSLLELYEAGLIQVEYDENLEATFHISEEGQKIAKEKGLIEIDFPEIPND